MRKIAILCLLALIPVAQIDTATGDTANPPGQKDLFPNNYILIFMLKI
jgi:hypothetical protein